MSQSYLDQSVSVTGGSKPEGPPVQKEKKRKGKVGRYGDGSWAPKKQNCGSDLRRKLNFTKYDIGLLDNNIIHYKWN